MICNKVSQAEMPLDSDIRGHFGVLKGVHRYVDKDRTVMPPRTALFRTVCDFRAQVEKRYRREVWTQI